MTFILVGSLFAVVALILVLIGARVRSRNGRAS
jgi:hypothetical protein